MISQIYERSHPTVTGDLANRAPTLVHSHLCDHHAAYPVCGYALGPSVWLWYNMPSEEVRSRMGAHENCMDAIAATFWFFRCIVYFMSGGSYKKCPFFADRLQVRRVCYHRCLGRIVWVWYVCITTYSIFTAIINLVLRNLVHCFETPLATTAPQLQLMSEYRKYGTTVSYDNSLYFEVRTLSLSRMASTRAVVPLQW